MDKLRAAVDRLEDVYVQLTRLCKRIEDTRPDDNPQKYKTVREFEEAWNRHYACIDGHQHYAHNYDEAVMAIEEALREVELPTFNLY